MTFKIHLPSDKDVEGYDLKALEGEVLQHQKNIETYERILVEERTRLTVAQNVVLKKKQLMAEKKNG